MRSVLLWCYCLLFFIASVAPLALMPFFRDQPDYENRPLAAFPQLVVEGRLNHRYGVEFEAWLSDHFALRPYVVTSYNLLYLNLFGESKQPTVTAGKDGWLFLTETLNDFQGLEQQTLSRQALTDLSKIISLAAAYTESQEKSFIFFVAPNKNSVYPSLMQDRFLRTNTPHNPEMLYKRLNELGVHYIDMHALFATLTSLSQTPYYHQTDSHWNNLGAAHAYEAIVQEVTRLTGDPFDSVLSQPAVPEYTHEGDLDRMLLPTLARNDLQYHFDIPTGYTSKKPILRYDAMEIITYAEEKPTTALMFRDSFANALIPFLSNQFGHIKYTRALPYNLQDMDFADVVIMEIVERNLPALLSYAPLMPAPDIAALPDGTAASVIPTEDAAAFVEEKNGLYYVYGFITVPSGGYYDMTRATYGTQTYEAFPVLDERLADSLDDPTLTKRGFAFYLAEEPTDEALSIVLTGENLAAAYDIAIQK